MKRIFRKLLCAGICVLLIFSTGCSTKKKTEDSGGLKIVVTVFPVYDWIRNLTAGSDAQVELLMKNGGDMHNYQPTVQDMVMIHDADLFIYIGGESDAWVNDVIKEADGSLTSVSLLETADLDLVEEKVKEGMTVRHEEDEDEKEEDEHVWLSLKRASVSCSALSLILQELDPGNASLYQANTKKYIAELKETDETYAAMVKAADKKTVIFADRFPFVYLMQDYGLDYYAAFPGCSAETGASFETVIFLAKKLDELGLHYVFRIENTSDDIPRVVIGSSHDPSREILVLNSMQSVNEKEAEEKTYIGIMKENLEILKKGLE